MADSQALTKPPEAELLEKQKAKTERKQLRLAERQAHLKEMVAGILVEAARKVALRKHAFKSDEDLTKLGLSDHEKALVRQWQEPKKSVAYAVESAARHVEAQVRGQAAEKRPSVNVENMVVNLPAKAESTIAPVVIDVEVSSK